MELNRRVLFAVAGAAVLPGSAAQADDDFAKVVQTQAQELVDAVTNGKADVFAKYMHPDAVYTDEEGTVSTKAQIVGQIGPLPKGISGVLRVSDFRARRFGDIVIANYVIDESEIFHGHPLHCQYRNTDTWILAPDGWRLLALQAMALRTDPPARALSAAQLDSYVGRYVLQDGLSFTVRRAGEGLEGQQSNGKARVLKAEIADVLFSPGRPRYRYLFMRDAAGRVDRMIERREGWDIEWTRAL